MRRRNRSGAGSPRQSSLGRSLGVAGLITLVIVVGAVLGTPSARAHHSEYLCDEMRWHYSNNEHWGLNMRFINWSLWRTDKDFIARRYSESGETYKAHIPTSVEVEHYTTTPSGYDLYRMTTIQRAGYSWIEFYMNEWSHDGCFS